MNRKVVGSDLMTYGVFDLWVSGSRFTDEYTEDDAVLHYLRLHPGAKEDVIRAELQGEKTRRSV